MNFFEDLTQAPAPPATNLGTSAGSLFLRIFGWSRRTKRGGRNQTSLPVPRRHPDRLRVASSAPGARTSAAGAVGRGEGGVLCARAEGSSTLAPGRRLCRWEIDVGRTFLPSATAPGSSPRFRTSFLPRPPPRGWERRNAGTIGIGCWGKGGRAEEVGEKEGCRSLIMSAEVCMAELTVRSQSLDMLICAVPSMTVYPSRTRMIRVRVAFALF